MSERRILYIVVASSSLVLAVRAAVTDSPSASSIVETGTSPRAQNSQPIAPVRPVTEDYFGTRVTDPYRYMEDLRDPQVQTWFKAQDDYTRAVLATIPGRTQLLERIKQLAESASYQVSDVQRFKGDKFYYQKRSASEEVGKLYYREGLSGNEKLLVDPEKFVSAPGTHT